MVKDNGKTMKGTVSWTGNTKREMPSAASISVSVQGKTTLECRAESSKPAVLSALEILRTIQSGLEWLKCIAEFGWNHGLYSRPIREGEFLFLPRLSL